MIEIEPELWSLNSQGNEARIGLEEHPECGDNQLHGVFSGILGRTPAPDIYQSLLSGH